MPLPRPDSEIKKRVPVPRLLLCWTYVIELGVNKKVQKQGNLCPFFLRCGLYCFFSIFSNFTPPPPIFQHSFFSNLSPHPTHKGSSVFLNIGLTQTCFAIVVPPGGYSHLFFTRRLGPSIYHSPQKYTRNFKHQKKKYLKF